MKGQVFDGPKDLERFARDCEEALFSGPHTIFAYPEGCSERHWPELDIAERNAGFGAALNGNGNIHAILTRGGGEPEWTPKYVGHCDSEMLGGWASAHLVYNERRIGSRLADVKSEAGRGREIAMSYITVRPDSLRHFVHEAIVRHSALEWNDRDSCSQRKCTADREYRGSSGQRSVEEISEQLRRDRARRPRVPAAGIRAAIEYGRMR